MNWHLGCPPVGRVRKNPLKEEKEDRHARGEGFSPIAQESRRPGHDGSSNINPRD